MARLIDANEALRLMRNSKADNPCTDTIRKDVWNVAHDCAISCVDACPTVDAVEVVHGRWVDRYGGKYANPLYECSECKEKAMYVFENDSLGIGLWKQKLTNYCPNCGAKMRGVEDGK